MERLKPKAANGAGSFFTGPSSSYRFISSGCTLLDLVIGGGWPLGRVSNIIGDASTGKTLLATEACANFAATYMGPIWYRDREHAFDQAYGKALGMPLSRVDFGKKGEAPETVEDLFDDMNDCVKFARKRRCPGLYVADSLDAFTEKADAKRKLGEGFPGKARKMSELFRRIVADVEQSGIHLMIISQVRTKIGIMFGDKTSCSGGKALEFYASQRLKLSHVANVVDEVKGIKRVTGIRIRAKCTKNKIGLAQRECEFILRFGFGVEDYQAAIDWLLEHKRTNLLGVTRAKAEDLREASDGWDTDEYASRRRALTPILRQAWADVEKDFLPARTKYTPAREAR